MSKSKALALTDMQAAFCRHVADGQKPTDAARMAGYGAPESAGWRLLQNPAIRAAAHAIRSRRLSTLAGKALNVLEDILDDKDAADKDRLAAARTLLDRAGHTARTAAPDLPEDSDKLSNMSVNDLQQALDDLARKRSELAREAQGLPMVIEHVPAGGEALDANAADALTREHLMSDGDNPA